MQSILLSDRWTVRPLGCDAWGEAFPARPVTIPHDAMLDEPRTEQSAGGEQCNLLDIHSNFPTFSISCQRPCTAGPIR